MNALPLGAERILARGRIKIKVWGGLIVAETTPRAPQT